MCLLCKPQKKDYLSINTFQTGSIEEYLIIKSYRGALVMEQEELFQDSTNESQWRSHKSDEWGRRLDAVRLAP